jgi:hypothetical protein
VVLQDREHLTCDRDRRVRAQRRAFVVDDDHQRLLAGWHQIFRAFSAHNCQLLQSGERENTIQNIHEMAQLARGRLGIFAPGTHVDDRSAINIEARQNAAKKNSVEISTMTSNAR